MSRERSCDALLWDMLHAAQDVIRFVEGKTYEQYLTDSLLQAAVERKVQIIGEAAGKIPEDFRSRHPQIPWFKIVTQRHRVTHEYYGVDPIRIWQVATLHVAELAEQLRAIMPPLPGDE